MHKQQEKLIKYVVFDESVMKAADIFFAENLIKTQGRRWINYNYAIHLKNAQK